MPNTHSTLTGLFGDIANAIRAKTGGSGTIVADTFPDAIAAIPTGGGSAAAKKDVNFYDYDGAIVKSYTATEFAALTAMPADPSHDGLAAQGWNWTLADAQAYVAQYGRLEIGQMYITSDGKTRLYIRLEDGRLAPYLGLAINGTATVEWGDGTSDTVVGTSTDTVISTQHTYAAAGDYVIAIAVSGSMALKGESGSYSQLFWGNNTESYYRDHAYNNAVQRVEIGADTSIGKASEWFPRGETFINYYSLASITIPRGCYIGPRAFMGCVSLKHLTIPIDTEIGTSILRGCYSLASVSIPKTTTNIRTQMFYMCYALSSVTIPDSVTNIYTETFESCESLSSVTIPSTVTELSNYAFDGCYSLPSVTIPASVESIDEGAFRTCYCLGYIKFGGFTPPTVSNSNAWTGVPTDCIIYVPRGSLAAYTSAANYPDPNTYSYVEYDP